METTEDFLAHYGVKGQKWGVRRKQNKVTGAATGNKLGTRQYNAKKLSNSDLKKVVQRMELEQRYATLNKPTQNKGASFARDFIQTNGGRIASGLVLTGASVGLGALLGRHNSEAADLVQRHLRPKK